MPGRKKLRKKYGMKTQKTEICLLDVDYMDAGERACILLYGRTPNRKRAVVVDPDYEPYFYVLPSHMKRAKREIAEVLRKENLRVRKMEEIRKIFWGEERDFLKISCFFPQNTARLRDIIKGLEVKRGGSGSIVEEYEYQMGFYRSYLADKGIACLDWLAVKGQPLEMNLETDIILEASSLEKFSGGLTDFKVLAFDTEVVEEKRGERQVIMASLYGERFRKVITYKTGSFPNDVEVVKNEKELLNRLVEAINSYDPDIVTGFNSDLYDFEVLRERASKCKVKLNRLSIDGSGITMSRRARVSAARLVGRVHIDLFNFIRNILAPMLQTEVLSLDAVSTEILGDEKIEMEYSEIVRAWKEGKNLEKLAEYCLKDSELTFRLSRVLLPQIFELTKIVGQSLFDTSRMMYSQLVEWYYTRRAKEQNRIIPNQPRFEEIQERQKEAYIGGFVLEPEAGLHENIVVIDFASLYPSISSTYNISLETLNCPCCKGDGYAVPDLPHWFCKKRKGFESEIIGDLLGERKKLKEELKRLRPESLRYKLLNIRQRAVKTIANASYGYYAFAASKWYSKECAESITAIGRYWIKRIIEEAGNKGFHPIYGDTDSAFLGLGTRKKKDLFRFLEEVNKELPGVMRMELEAFYRRGIFIPREFGGGAAKKRYALIDDKGNLKIRGLERVRRDWSNLAKKTQEEILKLVLEKKALQMAADLVRERIRQIKERRVDLKDLVVYEQVTRPLSEYKVTSPHIAAAQKLVERGIPVSPGSVIGFVIQKGEGSISQRAVPVEFAILKDIDADYYINHQILPSSLRVLKVLGVDEVEFQR